MIRVVPLTLKAACELVRRLHRHARPPAGGLFALGAADAAGTIVGAAIVGRPVARRLQDGVTAEVTRLVTDGTRNVCSMLYRAAWRAARALGYRRLITYTRHDESGASLRGAGFLPVATTRAYTWSRPSRRRSPSVLVPKTRWQIEAAA